MCLYSAARQVRNIVNDLTGYSAQQAAEAQARTQAGAARAQAEQAEAQRQANILQGRSAIDSIFGAFNDDFFSRYAQSYQDNYLPQISEQFQDARGKLASSLARTGMTASSRGADLTSQLQSEYQKQRQNVSSGALDAANQLRQQIEEQRSGLYGMNTGALDPTTIGNNAQLVASTFKAPPAYSQLGDLFTAAIDPLVAASAAAQNSSKGFNVGRYQSPIASNPSTIVR